MEQDRFIWIHTNSGDFSVATASSIIHNRREPGFPYHLLWHSFLPKKISFLARCALFHRLPVDTEIQGLGIPLASKCTCCSTPHIESITHILITGAQASSTWSYFASALEVPIHPADSLIIRFLRCSSHASSQTALGIVCRLLPLIIWWYLWKARNIARFEGQITPTGVIISQVRDLLQAILGMFNPAKLGGRRNLLRSIGIHLTCAEPRIVKLVQWATKKVQKALAT